MLRNFSGLKNLRGVPVKDPRIAMRLLIGVLLVANIAAAIAAFRPFGGSAEDLERQKSDMQSQVAALQAKLASTRKLKDKVETGRSQGDQFVTTYFMDARVWASDVTDELLQDATQSGVKPLASANEIQGIEGSDSMQMLRVTAGFEGNYQSLCKLINLIDKSPRFLIIESMQTAAPSQNAQTLTVQLKIDAFIRGAEGEL